MVHSHHHYEHDSVHSAHVAPRGLAGFNAGMYGQPPDWGASAAMPQFGAMPQMADPFGAQKVSGGARASNPPGTTLFIANLDSRNAEMEIRRLFESQPGYVHLKMQEMRGMPVAFVEFQDIATSAAALTSLQGHRPAGSTSGIRIEFAKSRMRSAGAPPVM